MIHSFIKPYAGCLKDSQRMKVEMGLAMAMLLLLLLMGSAQSSTVDEECSVELYDRIFMPSLSQMKIPYVLVEFCASWLPACQNYKDGNSKVIEIGMVERFEGLTKLFSELKWVIVQPEFEQVACIFNSPHPVHDGEVFVTRVDCAIESNKGLCDRFDVQTYPTMYWGPPQLLGSGGESSKAKLGLDSVGGGNVSTAGDLLNWINQRINKHYLLTDRRPDERTNGEFPVTTFTSANGTALWKVPGMLPDLEEATAHAFSYMMDEKRMRSSSRSSFIHFLHLLSRHHPSQRCREGSAKVLQNIATLWPLRQPPVKELREQQLCGPGLPRGFWETCDGDGHGYNCGLWLLLHALTVQIQDLEGTFAVSAINAFVSDFYQCDKCREQFLTLSSRISLGSAVARDDVVLWLWKVHNEVTKLVAQEELKVEGNSTRDVWPSEKECPACRDNDNAGESKGWDEEAVYYFLMDYYRPLPQDGALGELAQLSELEQQQQAVEHSMATVRYWAAGSVAVATCGLGFILRIFSNKSKKYKPIPERP